MERFGDSAKFRLAFSGYLIVDRKSVGGLENGDIEFPTLTALEDWLIQAKYDQETESALIRIKFPHTNNSVDRIQIAVPRAGDGAMEAQILYKALEDANGERRNLLAIGSMCQFASSLLFSLL